jgi:mRNA interferase HicA
VKQRDLIKQLETHGCALLREGNNHSVYVNRKARKSSAVPRHRDINDFQDLPRFGHSRGAALTQSTIYQKRNSEARAGLSNA